MLSCTDTPILKVYCNTPFFEVPVQRWTFTISLPNFLFSYRFCLLILYYFSGNATCTPFGYNLSCGRAKHKNKNSERCDFFQKCRLIKALPGAVYVLWYAVGGGLQHEAAIQFPVDYHILAISAIQFSKQPAINIQFAHQFVKSHLKNTPSWVILIRDGVMMEYFL